MRFKKINIFFIVFLFSFLLGGCEQEYYFDFDSNNNNTHIHQYSNTYEYNDEYHWQIAICEHDTLKSNYEAHEFGQWETTLNSTSESVGFKKKVCIDCGYEIVEEIPIHDHSYESNLSYDHNYHWYASACGCVDLKKDLYLHVMYENECIKCNYKSSVLDPTVDGITYKYDLNLGGYLVTAINANASGELHIPSTFNGEEVRGIDLDICPNANTIYIPSTIKFISTYSFYYSEKLVEVYNVSSLDVSSYFPYAKVFHSSYDEESAIIRLENGFEFVKNGNEYYLYAYEGDSEEVILPEEINGSEYEILKSAFSFNLKLTSFTATKGIKKFNYGIFERCDNLTELVLPYLGETINKPKGLSHLFTITSFTRLTKLTILEGDICDNATQYSYTNYLLELNFGSNVKSIGENAFEYSYNLTSITLPENLYVLSKNAFLGCEKLVEVYNLSNLTLDPSDSGCPSYYAEVIHKSLDSESVLCYEGDFVFYRKSENNYYLIQYRGKDTEVTLPPNINGQSYIIKSNTFDYISTIKTLNLGDGVIAIEEKGFNYCSIENVIFGNGITSIGDNTFYSCLKLESIILGDNVKDISSKFSYNCKNITYNVSNDICYLGTKNNDFYYMVYVKYPTLSKYVIHSDTIYIGEYAFGDCVNLTTIIIPNEVLEIKENAFIQASKLAEVYYMNLEPSITIDSTGNNSFNSAIKFYYSKDEPTTKGNYWYYNEDNEIIKW